MRTLTDTWTLARRSLRHITRSPDTIITVLLMPIALMLLFVYVWGGAMGQQTGSVSYIDFIVPGIIVMTVLSGIAYAAVRLSMDVQSGIINRFRTMPVAPSSILGGQVASSTLSNLFSSLVVLLVAFAMGFRLAGRRAGMAGLRRDPGAVHALDDVAGHLLRPARQDHGGGRRIQLHPASARVHQPLVRADDLHDAAPAGLRRASADDSRGRDDALAADRSAPPGPQVWTALAWILGVLVVSYLLSVAVYKRKAIVVNT